MNIYKHRIKLNNVDNLKATRGSLQTGRYRIGIPVPRMARFTRLVDSAAQHKQRLCILIVDSG